MTKVRLPRARWSALVILAAACCACSGDKSNRKETYPLTGTVLVDGQPAADLKVVLVDDKGVDAANPTVSLAYTDASGKFAVSTYDQGDGVPPGDYTLTFEWGQLNMLSMEYGGPDKLKGKYSDPKTSTIKVKVESGKPTDMGNVQLSTK
ncbi:MAG: carboxypeptidase regulatory-like domain-containing protein [Planctomycetes bacterium]|nr:carboxypeptidase regulatory-like domain-containing protein [Planctomycetota bacterium]